MRLKFSMISSIIIIWVRNSMIAFIVIMYNILLIHFMTMNNIISFIRIVNMYNILLISFIRIVIMYNVCIGIIFMNDIIVFTRIVLMNNIFLIHFVIVKNILRFAVLVDVSV
uniref:Uncharacterized protein n=1 Tax=Cacopsylla melanoneura TaxID=428564 RepID=A0A8D8Z6T9_9HEMI